MKTLLAQLKDKSIRALCFGFMCVLMGAHTTERHLILFFNELDTFLILLVMFFCVIIGNFIAPWVITRLGLKKAMFITGLLFAFWIFLMAHGNLIVAFGASIPFGFFIAMIWNSMTIYILKKAPDNPGAAFGLNHGFYALGGAIGLALCSFLLKYLSLSTILYGMALIAALGSFFFLQLEPVPLGEKVNPKEVFRVLFNRNILRLVLISVFLFYVYAAMDSQLIVDAKNQFGEKYIGYIQAIIFLCLAVISAPLGPVMQKAGKKKSLIVAFVTGFAGLAILYYSNSKPALILGVLLISLNHAILWILHGQIPELAPQEKTASTVGAFNVAADSTITFSLLLSWYINSRALYLFGLVGSVVVVVAIWPFLKAKSFDDEARRRLEVLK